MSQMFKLELPSCRKRRKDHVRSKGKVSFQSADHILFIGREGPYQLDATISLYCINHSLGQELAIENNITDLQRLDRIPPV